MGEPRRRKDELLAKIRVFLLEIALTFQLVNMVRSSARRHVERKRDRELFIFENQMLDTNGNRNAKGKGWRLKIVPK